LRLEILTDYPERLAQLDVVYVGRDPRRYEVAGCRLHQGIALLKLTGIDDRTAADALRGEMVFVAMEDAVPLEDHEVYEHQVEGLQVVTEDGVALGTIAEVLSVSGANDVFVVRGARGEILIPVIEDVIVSVDMGMGRLIIRVLPGLLDAV
jgi:16S rRNA processing protein RimM